MGLIIISVVICTGTLNLTQIIIAQKTVWFAIPLFPIFVMFFISALAETNRAPFDILNAETEIVAGYYTEYSSIPYALFIIGEYINIILMSAFIVILFLGGWLPLFDIPLFNEIPGIIWFTIKIIFLLFIFIWVKATSPRYRYDQLMRLGWKVFLPFSLIWVILTSSFLVGFDLLPIPL